MQKVIGLLGALLFTASCHASDPGLVLSAFHAALEAGDGSRALALLATDATIYESGFVERSRAQYASHHLAADMAFAKAVPRNVTQQSERLHDSQAVLWSETDTRGTFKGKPVRLIGTETAVLEKKDGIWLISHLHWSSRKGK